MAKGKLLLILTTSIIVIAGVLFLFPTLSPQRLIWLLVVPVVIFLVIIRPLVGVYLLASGIHWIYFIAPHFKVLGGHRVWPEDILLGVLGISFILSLTVKKEEFTLPPNFRFISVFLCCFLTSILLAYTVQGGDIKTGIVYLLRVAVLPVLLYFLVYNLVTNFFQIRQLIYIITFSSALNIFYIFIKYWLISPDPFFKRFGGTHRLSGSGYHSPNIVAIYIIIIIFLLLYLFLTQKKLPGKLLILSFSFPLLIILSKCASRSGYLMLFTLCIFFGCTSQNKKEKTFYFLANILVVLSTLPFLSQTVVEVPVSEEVLSQTPSSGEYFSFWGKRFFIEGSAYSRIRNFFALFHLIPHRAVIGWSGGYGIGDSIFLEILHWAGFPILVGLILVFRNTLRRLAHQRKKLRERNKFLEEKLVLYTQGITVGLIIMGFFTRSIFSPRLGVLWWFLLALAMKTGDLR